MKLEKLNFIENIKSVIYKKIVFIASAAIITAMWVFYFVCSTQGLSVGGGNGTKKLCMILTLAGSVIIYKYAMQGVFDSKRCILRPCLIFNAAMAYIAWFIFEMSCGGMGCELVFYLLETVIILCFVGVVYVFISKVWLSWLLSLIFFLAISYSNIFVIKYHLSPLTFRELENFGTAADVMSGYSFWPTVEGMLIIIAFILGVLLCIDYRKKAIRQPAAAIKQQIVSKAAIIFITAVIMVICTFFNNLLFPKLLNWRENVMHHGYVSCIVESVINLKNKFIVPDNYADDEVQRIENAAANEAGQKTPDIILILNETFYDMSNVMTYDADEDVMAAYNKLKSESIFGYTLAQGGTNWSEYEYLTSNSLAIMPEVTPFVSLNMKNAKGINSVLKENGYQSFAAHPAGSINYNRISGYPGLGFDKTYYIDDFKNVKYDGDRHFTLDQVTYDNCIEWYNDMGDAPRFCFVLTIQNHGGYEMNDPSFDTVHVKGDYKGNEQQMNEFFSSLKSSCEAFSEFVDYFRNSDRDVIICMAGDHRPIFTEDVMDNLLDENEYMKKLYSTPFIIWSNFDEKSSEDIGYIGMTQLVPYMLGRYNVKSDSYYEYIYQMTEKIPVLTSYGKYYSADGEIHSYNLHDFSSADSDGSLSLIRDYFYLEYNRVLPNLAR